MEFLECFPAGLQSGVRVEEFVEPCLVGVAEGVASACEQEPGTEHFGIEDGFGAVVSALDVAAHRGQTGGEPSDDTEPVQHMAGVWQTGLYRVLVGGRSVGDDDFDTAAPTVGLRHQKLCQCCA